VGGGPRGHRHGGDLPELVADGAPEGAGLSLWGGNLVWGHLQSLDRGFPPPQPAPQPWGGRTKMSFESMEGTLRNEMPPIAGLPWNYGFHF